MLPLVHKCYCYHAAWAGAAGVDQACLCSRCSTAEGLIQSDMHRFRYSCRVVGNLVKTPRRRMRINLIRRDFCPAFHGYPASACQINKPCCARVNTQHTDTPVFAHHGFHAAEQDFITCSSSMCGLCAPFEPQICACGQLDPKATASTSWSATAAGTISRPSNWLW